MKLRCILLLLTACMTACSKSGSLKEASTAKHSGGLGYNEDRLLTAAQKSILDSLRVKTGAGFDVRVWARGGTVSEMKLRVPVEGAPGTDLGSKATSFITTHGDLWNVGTADIRVVSTDTSSICPSATIQVFKNNAPVFNNMVRVYFDADGNVSGVIGGMTGRVLEPLDAAAPPAAEALTFLKEQYGADPEQTAASTPAIVDPFFLTDSVSEPRHATVFTGSNEPDQPPSVSDLIRGCA